MPSDDIFAGWVNYYITRGLGSAGAQAAARSRMQQNPGERAPGSPPVLAAEPAQAPPSGGDDQDEDLPPPKAKPAEGPQDVRGAMILDRLGGGDRTLSLAPQAPAASLPVSPAPSGPMAFSPSASSPRFAISSGAIDALLSKISNAPVTGTASSQEEAAARHAAARPQFSREQMMAQLVSQGMTEQQALAAVNEKYPQPAPQQPVAPAALGAAQPGPAPAPPPAPAAAPAQVPVAATAQAPAKPLPYVYGTGPASAGAQANPPFSLGAPPPGYAYGQGPASASSQALPPPTIPGFPFQNGTSPQAVIPSVLANGGQEAGRAIGPALSAVASGAVDAIKEAAKPLPARPGPGGKLPYAFGQGPASAQSQAQLQVESKEASSTKPSGSKKAVSLGDLKALAKQPGLSRDERVDRTARAMIEIEKRAIMRTQGVEEHEAAQMVNVETIRRAAEGQVAGEISDEGLAEARSRDAEDRRRAVTATGPQAAQMASEDAVTQRIRNQNQNARTRGLGGQNRLWDENDPETRAMVAQQIASEEKASNERAIADTGLGTRRVPTPVGAGGERSKQGAAFASAEDAENYARRTPSQPTLGEDGLPVGGKPGLYKPSQKDIDMAKRGMVPVFGPRGEIGYAVAAFSEPVNGAPGAAGRAGHRPDLEKAGYYVVQKMGPTGMQTVYAPGSELQEKVGKKKESDLIDRLQARAGVSDEQMMELTKADEQGNPALSGNALIERLRKMGNASKNADAASRAAAVRDQRMLNGSNPGTNAVNLFRTMPEDWRATVAAQRLAPGLSGKTPNDVAAANAAGAGRTDEILSRLGMNEANLAQRREEAAQENERRRTESEESKALRREELAQMQRQFESQQQAARDAAAAAERRHATEMEARRAEAAAAENRHSQQLEQNRVEAAARAQEAAQRHEIAIRQLQNEMARNEPAQAESALRQKAAEQAAADRELELAASSAGFKADDIRRLRHQINTGNIIDTDLANIVAKADKTTFGSPFAEVPGYSAADKARFRGALQAAGVTDPAEQEMLWKRAVNARYDNSTIVSFNGRASE